MALQHLLLVDPRPTVIFGALNQLSNLDWVIFNLLTSVGPLRAQGGFVTVQWIKANVLAAAAHKVNVPVHFLENFSKAKGLNMYNY